VTSSFKKIGYYAGWSAGGGSCGLTPESVPFNLYTHIIYAFGGVNADGSLGVDAADDQNIQQLVSANKGQSKIMLAIGGWNYNDPGPTQARFTNMVASPALISKFCNSASDYLASRGLAGLDFDWECKYSII
jgi:GH18 family chitinase